MLTADLNQFVLLANATAQTKLRAWLNKAKVALEIEIYAEYTQPENKQKI